jgi:hypothetical protein
MILTSDVDWEATREKLKYINLPVWARAKGFGSGMVRQIVNECYPHEGKKSYRVVQALYQDGFLVLKEKEAA